MNKKYIIGYVEFIDHLNGSIIFKKFRPKFNTWVILMESYNNHFDQNTLDGFINLYNTYPNPFGSFIVDTLNEYKQILRNDKIGSLLKLI